MATMHGSSPLRLAKTLYHGRLRSDLVSPLISLGYIQLKTIGQLINRKKI
jgi:hypothetical protein